MSSAEIAALKVAFSAASVWSEWCVIAVTVGVFIEFLALFIFSKEMPKSEKWVMGIATLVIVIGCGGEYVFGERATSAATQLQSASDIEVARLGVAAKALESDVSNARRDAANANARAGEANKAVADANQRTAALEARAAAAQLDAEQARLAQARVKSVVAWRNLPIFVPRFAWTRSNAISIANASA